MYKDALGILLPCINHQYPTVFHEAWFVLHLQLSHHLECWETPHRGNKPTREKSWGGCAVHQNPSIKTITRHKSINEHWSIIQFPTSKCKDVWNESPGGAGCGEQRNRRCVPCNEREPSFCMRQLEPAASRSELKEEDMKLGKSSAMEGGGWDKITLIKNN